MPNPELFMTCPFCREMRSNIVITGVQELRIDTRGLVDKRAKARGMGTCYMCKNEMLVYLEAHPVNGSTDPLAHAVSKFPDARRYGENLVANGWEFRPIQTLPARHTYENPKGLSEEVAEALEDARINMQMQRWRPAVVSYGTALDFTCASLLPDGGANMTIGQKLKALSGSQALPQALITFIESANLDRIAAAHYPSKITEAQAEAVRTLTIAVLEYLYTMPARLAEAEERLQAARAGGVAD